MRKYYLFLLLTCLLSIPFYIWGVVSPVSGLPFGLPISFVMIFIPFILALVYAWKESRRTGVLFLFKSIFDLRKARLWAAIFCITSMPVAVTLSFYVMKAFPLPLPAVIVFPVEQIPAMLVLYFLGTIPEEFGWTMTLTDPMAKALGPIKAGAMIGGVWALWHVIPWSLAHPIGWVAGMVILTILMRIGMVYAFVYGGRSLFFALVFHTMINVSTGLFPNSMSHLNPLVISACFLLILGLILGVLFALHFQVRRCEDPPTKPGSHI